MHLLIVLAILVVGLAVILVRLALHASRTRRSGDWAMTEATVFSADARQSGDLGGHAYSAEFTYSYSIGGEYFSGRMTIPVSFSEKETQKLVDRFPRGTMVKVRYRPEDPSNSYFRIEDQS